MAISVTWILKLLDPGSGFRSQTAVTYETVSELKRLKFNRVYPYIYAVYPYICCTGIYKFVIGSTTVQVTDSRRHKLFPEQAHQF
jgi:hypothetical protein